MTIPNYDHEIEKMYHPENFIEVPEEYFEPNKQNRILAAFCVILDHNFEYGATHKRCKRCNLFVKL